jgi:hypothetical protein
MLSFVAGTRKGRWMRASRFKTLLRWRAMLADSLPTNAWLCCEMRPSQPQHAVMRAFDECPAKAGRSERADRNQAGHARHRVAAADRKALLRFATRLLPLLAASVVPLCSPTRAAERGQRLRDRPHPGGRHQHGCGRSGGLVRRVFLAVRGQGIRSVSRLTRGGVPC